MKNRRSSKIWMKWNQSINFNRRIFYLVLIKVQKKEQANHNTTFEITFQSINSFRMVVCDVHNCWMVHLDSMELAEWMAYDVHSVVPNSWRCRCAIQMSNDDLYVKNVLDLCCNHDACHHIFQFHRTLTLYLCLSVLGSEFYRTLCQLQFELVVFDRNYIGDYSRFHEHAQYLVRHYMVDDDVIDADVIISRSNDMNTTISMMMKLETAIKMFPLKWVLKFNKILLIIFTYKNQ